MANCITAAEQAHYQQLCFQKSQVIKGVGADATDPCVLAKLPVCPPPGTPGASSTSSKVVWGSIILLLVAGGAYTVYRLRK